MSSKAEPPTASAGPLQGIRILDLSAVVSGPLATMILAEQGADVVKVEPPGMGDSGRHIGPGVEGCSALFAICNRAKRSIVIDLATPEGVELVRSLAAQVDVVVENFRPGVVDRLGIGYADLKSANPELIYASISGFGPDGPKAGQRVYDPIIQAASGLAVSQTAAGDDAPSLIYSLICDKVAGVTAAQAITAALLARYRGLGGQHLQVSMLEACLAFNWPDLMWNHTFADAPPASPAGLNQTYRLWPTRDGHIAAVTVSEEEFRGWCRALGSADLLEDPRFPTHAARRQHARTLTLLWQARLAAMTTREALERFEREGVPAGPVNSPAELLGDPQVLHSRIVQESHHPVRGRVLEPGPGARLAGWSDVPRHAPDLGAHSSELLAEFGYDAPAIARLIAAGTVK